MTSDGTLVHLGPYCTLSLLPCNSTSMPQPLEYVYWCSPAIPAEWGEVLGLETCALQPPDTYRHQRSDVCQ